MKFRLGLLIGAVASALIVFNMTEQQRRRFRSAASTIATKVRTSETADQVSDLAERVDEAAADAIDDAVSS